MSSSTRSRKRLRKEKDVTWTRTEIAELIVNIGSTLKPPITERSRNVTKARFLQKYLSKFNDVPSLTIEKWIHEMGRNKENFTRFYTPIDEKIEYYSTTHDDINERDIIKSLRGTILGLQTQKKILEAKQTKNAKTVIEYQKQLERKNEIISQLKSELNYLEKQHQIDTKQ
eukprot:183609_1